MEEKVKVVIVDDHPIVQDAIESKLAGKDNLELVAKGDTGEDVLRLVAKHRPDILILDLRMPQSTKNSHAYFQAIPTINEISEQHPDTRIIILTSYLVPELVQEALHRKVRGYLLKRDRLTRKLPEAIDTVMMGSLYFSETVYKKLSDGSSPIPEDQQTNLTPRQLEVLKRKFSAPDLSNAQHAANMGITVSTFRQHLSAAYKVLGVPNATAAMVRGVQLGIVGDDTF